MRAASDRLKNIKISAKTLRDWEKGGKKRARGREKESWRVGEWESGSEGVREEGGKREG